ncbi:MAG: MFS transporter [Burkholderiales bacterium]|nr:MFS transporter [Burkholderiales bacterium]
MSSTATLPAGAHAAPDTPQQDRRTVAVVSTAHGCSHFFHLILAPLFPWIKAEFSLSYAELGLLMTVFFIVSGVGQALAGFVVDRIGAVPVMLAALCSFVVATLILSTAPSYAMLMVGSVFAGLGNAPFHPVDYSILNARIAPARLAKAYALHGVAGNLGWALAPVFLVGITGLSSWRTAIACAGLLAAAILLMIWLHRALLAGQPVGALGIVHAQPVDATRPSCWRVPPARSPVASWPPTRHAPNRWWPSAMQSPPACRSSSLCRPRPAGWCLAFLQ